MATIKSALVLNDRMTNVLNRINFAMTTVIDSCETMQLATGQAVDVHQFDAARVAIGEANSAIVEMQESYRGAAAGQDKLNKKIQNGTTEAGALLSQIKNIAGAYLGLSAIKNVVGKAINYASDLQEVQNVVDVTFGGSSNIVDKWAKNTLYSFGLSELSAKRYAGTMGAMLKSSGLTGKSVDSMSMKMTELAGDMASFYNLKTDEAFAKIRSGISGETEPLKQLGINLNIANLESYALSQGITKSYDSMTQAEQVMLRYNYLLSATTDAQGDFTRTIDSYANQTKLLKENWSDFTGQLAQSTLPILASGVKVLNSGIRGLSENWNIIAPLATGLVTIVGAYTAALAVHKAVLLGTTIAKGVSTVVEYAHAKSVLNSAKAAGIKTAGLTVETTATAGLATATGVAVSAEAAFQIATAKSTVAQAAFNTTLLASPITWIVLGVIALISGLVALCNWFAKAQGISTDCFGAIVGGVYVVGAAFKNLGLLGKNIFLGLQGAWGAFSFNMKADFQTAISGVQSWFYNLLSTALGVIGNICAALNKLPFVEFDYSGITGAAEKYAQMSAEAAKNTGGSERKDVIGAFSKGFNTYDAFADGWAKNAFVQGTTKYNEWKAAKGPGADDKYFEEISGNTGATAGSAGSIADSLTKTNEELEWIRDMAEREAINRFTTAEVKVDFSGMTNQISSDVDLDGFVSGFVTLFEESLQTAAQGVY